MHDLLDLAVRHEHKLMTFKPNVLKNFKRTPEKAAGTKEKLLTIF